MSKSKNKIFSDLSISNKVSRNGFDLSFTNKFTAKVGELLPLMHRDVMFGDKWKISLDSFSRTRPVVSPAYTRINEYFDFFFVPYRVLGKNIPHVITQDTSNPTIASSSISVQKVGTKVPYTFLGWLRGFTSPGVQPNLNGKYNPLGFDRGPLSNKLLNHLGYCYVSTDDYSDEKVPSELFAISPEVSLLPLAAYQKIYYDFYRNTQWEESVPYNYNFDYMGNLAQYEIPASTIQTYWNNHTMFDMCYANYPKDLFFGLLPDNQLGDTAVVDVDVWSQSTYQFPVRDGDGIEVSFEPTSVVDVFGMQNSVDPGQGLAGNPNVDIGEFARNLKGQFDILEWRKSNFVQKYREIMGTGRKDYKSIVQKIFNVNIPDILTDMCIYLGGHSQTISISEVENTNLADGNEANLRGKGVGNGKSSLIDFEAKEPGIIMCIYHAMPEIDYSLNAFHFDVVKTEVDDFANPVFDKLGLQEFPTYFLDNTPGRHIEDNMYLGFTNRYFDYKTSVDVVLGDFRESLDMQSWVAPISPDYLLQFAIGGEESDTLVVTSEFFKVNPRLLDKIFDINSSAHPNTDQLRVKTSFDIQVVRNLDYLGQYF